MCSPSRRRSAQYLHRREHSPAAPLPNRPAFRIRRPHQLRNRNPVTGNRQLQHLHAGHMRPVGNAAAAIAGHLAKGVDVHVLADKGIDITDADVRHLADDAAGILGIAELAVPMRDGDDGEGAR